MRTSSILLVILLILTFPLWIGIVGGLFGLMVGLIGGAIGIVAGVFGAVIGAIGAVIGGIFGWAFDDWHFPFYHFNTFWVLVIVICVVLLVRGRREAR